MRKTTLAFVGIAWALAAAAAVAGPAHSAACYNNGPNAPEQVGDRQGHMFLVSSGTCLESGGVLEGTVTTQNTIWEIDSTGSKILSGDGVGRKPGALIAYRLLEGTMQTLMQDGKPAGWIAKGKGLYTLGTGEFSALTGKTFTWTTKPAGPRRYTIEAFIDD